MNTKYLQIKEIGKVVTGKTPSTDNESNFGFDYPFITPTDIKSFFEKRLRSTERGISANGANSLRGNMLPPNSVCFVCIGSTIGKMCLTSANSFTNQQINSVIVNKQYDSNYIFYLLRYVKGYFQQLGAGTGSGKGIVNKTTFENTKIPIIENEPFQCRIASILSVYDELIERNNRKIAILQEQAQELYKEWFVRFRFPGHETAKFENGLPEGWRRTTVEELSDVLRRGISPEYSDDGALIVISQKCIRGSIMDVKKARNQVKRFSDELNLLDSDTVICSTGTGTLGRVGQIFGEYPNTSFDSHVTLVRARNGISKQYLFFALSSMQAWFMSMGIGSTNQQELYRGTIKNAKVVLPNKDIMNLFEAIAKGIHERITVLGRQSDILTRQRDLLLPRLMSGKLEVH